MLQYISSNNTNIEINSYLLHTSNHAIASSQVPTPVDNRFRHYHADTCLRA